MQFCYQRIIELQQWFATRANNEPHPIVGLPRGPLGRYGISQRRSGCKAATARSVGSHEVGVAEPAGRRCAILLPPRPQIAPREPAKHSRSARLGALALQRIENLFDRVTHGPMVFMRVSDRIAIFFAFRNDR